MIERSVRRNYSLFNSKVLETEGRLKIAKQIVKVLSHYSHSKDPKSLRVLDIGCSSGIITNHLASVYGEVVGIDVDKRSIAFAKKKFAKRNLQFFIRDGAKTLFPDSSFDIIISNQVYYCFARPQDFFSEVYRLLKSGGICYLGARNKYTLWDAQYELALLSFMPRKLADFFVRSSGRSEKYDVEYRTYWQLKKLCKRFDIRRITPKGIHNPSKYGFEKVKRYEFFARLIPESFLRRIEPILPNFVWLLVKPE